MWRKLITAIWRPQAAPSESKPGTGYLDALASEFTDVIARLGPDFRIDYATPSSLLLYGYTPEEMVGRSVLEFVAPDDHPVVMATAARLRSREVEHEIVIVRAQRKDGTMVWTEVSVRLALDPVQGIQNEVVIVRDISERKKVEDQLLALATTDGLTGLRNRRTFDDLLERQWQVTLQQGTTLSLILLDVDHFKLFNDHYGHQVGDDCLRAVGAAVARAIRAEDCAARYGGEEFAVILPDADAEAVAAISERVRAAVEALGIPHGPRPEGAHVTVSIGAATAVACVGGSMRMPESLVAAADTALYKAKHNGRNRTETSMLLAPITGEVCQIPA